MDCAGEGDGWCCLTAIRRIHLTADAVEIRPKLAIVGASAAQSLATAREAPAARQRGALRG